MKTPSIYRFMAITALAFASQSWASINPITVTYQNGTTSFSSSASGTANYVVTANAAIVPAGAPLSLLVSNAGASQGLEATQSTPRFFALHGCTHCL